MLDFAIEKSLKLITSAVMNGDNVQQVKSAQPVAAAAITLVVALIAAIASWFMDETGAIAVAVIAGLVLASLAFFVAQKRSAQWAFVLGALGVAPIAVVLALRFGPSSGTVTVGSDPEPSPTAQSSVVAGDEISKPLSVEFESPGDRAKAPVAGVTVSGTVSGDVGDRSLWLFVKSPDDGGVHYLTDKLAVEDSFFSMSTGQLGARDVADNGDLFVVEVVAADSAANAKIESKLSQSDAGDVPWRKLPQGAEVVGERSVVRAAS